jgi:hypothetical protein
MKIRPLFGALLVAATTSALAQSSQWVAFNDHYRGANTGPNVATWNIQGATANSPGNAGPLTNVASGGTLSASLLISNATAGATFGTAAGGPNAGTPAALAFTNYIDFGSGTLNHAVQLATSARIAHIFSGLDGSRRYSWRGTAVRANNYTDRWTLLEIAAAASTPNHTSAVVNTYFTTTDIGSLTSTQVVCNFGENRAAGMLAGWDNIQPNADGTIVIYMSTWRGTMPAGFSSAGVYGYAIQADRLEEFTTGGDTAITITGNPNGTNVAEHGVATFTVTATGSPLNYYWRKNGTPIPGANSSSYTTPPVSSLDNGAVFSCLVSNSVSQPVSSGATLSVTADTVRPVALWAIANTNLTTVIVAFSEALAPGSVTPSAFQIYPTSGSPGANVDSATLTNGTNVILTTTTAPIVSGQNYSVRITGVTDTAGVPNVILPNPTVLPIQQTVIVFPFTKTWRYEQSGSDLGTSWKDVGYNDSAWLSGSGILGFETTAATLTFLTSIAPPTGTNTVLTITNNTVSGLHGTNVLGGPNTSGTNVTIYFRTAVNIGNFNPATATMVMRGYFDDGAAIYVNGAEALRYNLPAAAGYTTFATANLPEAVLTVSNLTGFVQGDNVIAVEVHQDAVNSSDLDFGMQLEALVATFSPGGPRLTTSVNGSSLTITWPGGGTLQRSTDISSPANWTAIPGAASPFVTNTSGGLKFFRVTVP